MEKKTINPSAGTIKEVQKMINKKKLKSLKLNELKNLAKKIGIKGFSKLKKDLLLDLIEKTTSKETSSKKTTSEEDDQSNTKPKSKKILSDLSENNTSKYEKLGLEKIANKLEEIIQSSNWMYKNLEIQDLIKIFKEKFQREFKKAEKKYLIDNSENKKFKYNPEYKSKFDKKIIEYRDKKRKYYKELDHIQNKNYDKKLEIIENIKKLIDKNKKKFEEKYKEFKKIQESWHSTGSVPRSKDHNMWQTYKHHVERFYDFLHLDRELRDIDYKHNYEEKLKIIEKAESLTQENDIIKSSRNINILHKKWKNELGPVAKEHRQILWKKFQIATKTIQNKRKEFQKNALRVIKTNINTRNEILIKMKSCINENPNNHIDWQNKIVDFNKLREDFKKIGYIPNKDAKSLWKNFRDISKSFMISKNEFYKKQKTEHKTKIIQKTELIKIIKQYIERDDWEEKIDEVKKIQIKWKSIGFIPRKIDNKLWKEFSNLNSIYFQRIKSGYNKLNKDETELYKLKNEYINELNKLKISKNLEGAIKKIQTIIKNWNEIGQVNIKVNEKLNQSFKKSLINTIENNKSLNKIKEDLIFESKLILTENKIDVTNSLQEEFIKKEKNLKSELNQLENNLDFFTNSSSNNPIVKDVEKKIRAIKNQIDSIKEKKKKLSKSKIS